MLFPLFSVINAIEGFENYSRTDGHNLPGKVLNINKGRTLIY